jgi:basic amino acid/polyamine antiporter, APA family
MNGNDNGDTNEQGSLGLWSVISIIVGIVVGVSIFKVPGTIFAFSSDPWTGLLVWAFGGLLALTGAFCYAELATTYPRSGGDYVYLTRAFGPWCGFLFGWAQLSVILPASIGLMAIVFADAATPIYEIPDFMGLGLSSEFTYAVAAVLVLSVLNIVGVTFGKVAQNVLTVVKVVGLLAIIVAGFGWAESSPLDWRLGEPGTFVGGGAAGQIGWGSLATILVLYAYGGWNDAAFVAAEVRHPRRNIPLALLLGVGLITLLYMCINLAYLTGLGFDGVKAGDVPARLLQKAFGDQGATAMRVVVMISALGAANALIFAGARVYATLGNDYSLFGWLGFWRPGHGAPILALIAQSLITVFMILAVATSRGQNLINEAIAGLNQGLTAVGLNDQLAVQTNANWNADGAFNALVTYTAPVFWAFFLATGFSLFALRSKEAERERPFPVPLYPILPFVFCNMCVYMLYQSIKYIEYQALFAGVLVLFGLPLYFLSRAVGYRGDADN